MNGDERTQPQSPEAFLHGIRRRPAPEAITLHAGAPGDGPCIRAWIEHLEVKNRHDLAEAARAAASIVVRRRWPREDTPLPRIPLDFVAKITGER
jgi:hypothetical protein